MAAGMGSSGRIQFLATVTIALAATDKQLGSPIIKAEVLQNYDSVWVIAPGTLPETVKINTVDHLSDETVRTNYRVAQDPVGTDLTIAAGKTIAIRAPAAAALGILATADVAADRVFYVYGHRHGG